MDVGREMRAASLSGILLVAFGLAGAALGWSSPAFAATTDAPPSSEQPAAPDTPAPAPAPSNVTVNESYDAWHVICSKTAANPNNCSMVQEKLNDQGQRLMAVELRPDGATMSGTLVMPFGLLVQKPVKLQVDNAAKTATFPFVTCLYTGCVVAVTFDEQLTAAVRAGNVLKVGAVANDNSALNLEISLAGASKAADRVSELAAVKP